MKKIFISDIKIEHVRHLKNIDISLSKDEAKHLIFTGKNGSGKTSVLEAVSSYLNTVATSERLNRTERRLQYQKNELKRLQQQGAENLKIIEVEEEAAKYAKELDEIKSGVCVELNESEEALPNYFGKGQLKIAY